MLTAYLDAGTGSLIATFLVGGIASVGVAFRTLRSRVKGMFSRGDSSAESAESEAVPAEAAAAETVDAES